MRSASRRPAVNSKTGAERALRAGFGVMLMTLLAVPGRSAPAIALASARPVNPVSVSLDDARGHCHARGRFHAAVSVATAWQVLTDYEGIPRFVPSVRESRLEQDPNGQRRLWQDAVGSAFMMRHRVHVLLQLDEVVDQRIAFRDVLGEDFREYAGEWRVVPDTAGVRIEYELRAEPSSAMLRLFCRGALLRGAQDLLGQVREEMLRRGTTRKS
jgi:ribosome-associated toxin RatA of RatAB toxin-antitoxin module